MIIPFNVHKEKDKELIDWLTAKTNRSAFMRIVLYNAMKQEKQGVLLTQQYNPMPHYMQPVSVPQQSSYKEDNSLSVPLQTTKTETNKENVKEMKINNDKDKDNNKEMALEDNEISTEHEGIIDKFMDKMSFDF